MNNIQELIELIRILKKNGIQLKTEAIIRLLDEMDYSH